MSRTRHKKSRWWNPEWWAYVCMREYGGNRPGNYHWPPAGRMTKDTTHRLERAESKRIVLDEERDLYSEDDCQEKTS